MLDGESAEVDDFVTSQTYANLVAWQQFSPKKWNDSDVCKALMLRLHKVHAAAETQLQIGGSQNDDVEKSETPKGPS